MAWYTELTQRMRDFALPQWDELPDLGLYMDQVITYLQRQYRPVYGEEKRIITPAMINNYVKSGLVARPVGKKYDRPQLAQLMMLCALKQAVSLEDMRQLAGTAQGEDVRARYEDFLIQQQAMAAEFADILPSLTPMQGAVRGAAYMLLCMEMLHAETAQNIDDSAQ